MKKIWIAAAGLAAVLVVALLLMNLMTPRQTMESGDAESPYPYSYELRSDGLHVYLEGEKPAGAAWVSETDSLSVTVTEKKQNAKRAEFLIAPQQTGNAQITFSLTEGQSRSFEIVVEVFASSEGKLSVIANHHQALESVGVEASSGETSCRIDSLSDGSLAVVLTAPDADAWLARVEGEAVRVEQGDYHEETSENTFLIRYQELGQGTVTLYLPEQENNEEIVLDVATDLLEKVTLLDSRGESAKSARASTSRSDSPRLQDVYGDVRLPADALRFESSVVDKVVNGRNVQLGVVGFALDAKYWALYLTYGVEVEDMLQAVEAGAQTGAYGDADLYENGSAIWLDKQDRLCVLQRPGVTQEELTAALAVVMEAVGHG